MRSALAHDSQRPDAAAVTAPAVPAPLRAGGPQASALQLQRRVGNRAVGRMIQRRIDADAAPSSAGPSADQVTDEALSTLTLMRRPCDATCGDDAGGELPARLLQRRRGGANGEASGGASEGGGGPPHAAARSGRAEFMATLPMSRPDDASEREADRTAARVVGESGIAQLSRPPPQGIRRSWREPGSLDAGTARLAAAAAQSIRSPAGGRPLPAALRGLLEPRFGADLSGVRVHTGPGAHALADQLDAEAFTWGRHIWFGEGGGLGDLSLVAHEVTHVLQQAPPPPVRGPPLPAVGSPATLSPLRIQRRVEEYYAPRDDERPRGRRGRGRGTKTHELLLPRILADAGNADLFSEVNIPGGAAAGVAQFVAGERGVVGRPDFYKASTTIGVKFEGSDPTPFFLGSHSDLRRGARAFDHIGSAAPAGLSGVSARSRPRVCPTATAPGICRLDTAPTAIRLGDLKPASEAERRLGTGQLDNYIAGIRSTKGKVDAFAAAHPAGVHPAGGSWTPSPGRLGAGDVRVPADLTFPNTSGRTFPVIRYVNGRPESYAQELPAHPYVVFDTAHPGIWYYEYVPTGRPTDTSRLRAAQQAVDDLLRTQVQQPLKATPAQAARRRRRQRTTAAESAPRAPPVRPHRVTTRRIQRNGRRPRVRDDFDHGRWNSQSFAPWRRQARTYLRSPASREVGQVSTLLAIKERSFSSLAVPAQARELRVRQRRIEHWEDHGPVYGRLRQVFGTTFVKVLNAYERVRERFREAVERRRGARGGASGVLGVVIRVAFTMLKQFAATFVRQVGQILADTFRTRAEALIHGIVDAETEDYEEQIASVQQTVTGFTQAAQRDFESVVGGIVAPFERHLETIERVRELVTDIARIVNLVKWAVRIASCGAPPALGCLWGLVGTTVLELGAQELADSCWFRREILFPILRDIEFVRALPASIASRILGVVQSAMPEQPAALRQLFDPVDTTSTTPTFDDAECGQQGSREPAGEQRGVLDLYQQYGAGTIDTFLVVMRYQGVLSGTPMTFERIAALRAFFEQTGMRAPELRAFLRSNPQAAPESRTFEEALEQLRQHRAPPPPPPSSPPRAGAQPPPPSAGQRPESASGRRAEGGERGGAGEAGRGGARGRRGASQPRESPPRPPRPRQDPEPRPQPQPQPQPPEPEPEGRGGRVPEGEAPPARRPPEPEPGVEGRPAGEPPRRRQSESRPPGGHPPEPAPPVRPGAPPARAEGAPPPVPERPEGGVPETEESEAPPQPGAEQIPGAPGGGAGTQPGGAQAEAAAREIEAVHGGVAGQTRPIGGVAGMWAITFEERGDERGYDIYPAAGYDPGNSYSILRPGNSAAILELRAQSGGTMEVINVARGGVVVGTVRADATAGWQLISGPLRDHLEGELLNFIVTRRNFPIGRYPLHLFFR